MKVITEERLRELYNINNQRLSDDYIRGMMSAYESLLFNECQELDTLTVTSLRPMSDIPIGETVLMKTKLMDSFYATVISEDDYLDGCDGWIPMPRYEPEKV